MKWSTPEHFPYARAQSLEYVDCSSMKKVTARPDFECHFQLVRPTWSMQTNLLNKRNFVSRFHSGNKVRCDFEKQMVGILTLTTRSVGLFWRRFMVRELIRVSRFEYGWQIQSWWCYDPKMQVLVTPHITVTNFVPVICSMMKLTDWQWWTVTIMVLW